MSYVSREIHTRQCCCTVCTNFGCHCHTAVCSGAFPVAASRIWNCLPLHVTSAPYLFRLSIYSGGSSRFCSAAVSHHDFSFPFCDFVLGLAASGLMPYSLHNCRSQWSSGNTLACGARGPRFASRCGRKFVFSRKSLRYAALGTGCTLTAVPRSTQPSTLRGMVNEFQPYG